MNQDFKQCLENRKIIAFPRGKELVNKELSIAQSDLSDAKASFENQQNFLNQGLKRLSTLPRDSLKRQL